MFKYKKIYLAIILCMLSVFFQSASVNAENVPVTGTFSAIHITREDISDQPWVDPGDDPGETDENGECNVGDIECFEKQKEDNIQTSDFLSQGLYSLDKNTRAKEVKENYIVNFNNSSTTAMTKGFSLFDGSSIAMFFINILTLVLEMIGLLVSFITLISYNFASSTMIVTTVRDAFTAIEKVVFDWSNPNSWIIKIIVISAVLSIIYKLISTFKKNLMPKQLITIVLSVFMSSVAIVGVGIYGRPILTATESALHTMIIQTFSFDTTIDVPEIVNKRTIFETMQLQPFMLRHFGTTSYEVIAKMHEGGTVEEAKTRVQTLLNNPTKDNAKKEKTVYGNKYISQNIGTSSQVLLLSLITVVHRTLMGIIIIILCVVAMCIKLLKELLIAMSVYQLIYWLFKHTHGAFMWFSNRLMWSIISIVTDIGLSVALFFVFNTCASIATTNTLFLIVFDIIILVLLILLYKNFGSIMQKIKQPVEDTVKGILTGDAPGDIYYRLKYNNYSSNESLTNDIDDDSFDSGSALSDGDSGNGDLSDVDADNNNLGDTDISDPNMNPSDNTVSSNRDSNPDLDENRKVSNDTTTDESSSSDVKDNTNDEPVPNDINETSKDDSNTDGDQAEVGEETLSKNETEELDDEQQPTGTLATDDIASSEDSNGDDLADEYDLSESPDGEEQDEDFEDDGSEALVDQELTVKSNEPLNGEYQEVHDVTEQDDLEDKELTSDDSTDKDIHDEIQNDEDMYEENNIAEDKTSNSGALSSNPIVVDTDKLSIDDTEVYDSDFDDYLDEELLNENNS